MPRLWTAMMHADGRRARAAAWLALAAVAVVLAGLSSGVAQNGRSAVVLHIDGPIGPATVDYVARGLETAGERDAAVVVLRMDTPGGLDNSMRQIIRDILASPIPVITFVAPSGARAASAGTYILYASHVAAMAPGTNLGAATPVQVGGGGLPFGGQDEEQQDQQEDEGEEGDDGQSEDERQPKTATEAKMVNDAVAYIRSLAEMRGRNADWAEKAVRQAASLSSSEALELDVIDITATSIDDVLAEADGRQVTAAGEDIVLDTRGLPVDHVRPGWRTELLSAITNPNIALILMMVGIYGLIFEFLNPGALYPGVIGAISLLIGLYALAALPVNYAGLGLMVLGIGLIIAEAFSPAFGILGIGGAVAFVLGATILIEPGVPGFEIAWPVIAVIGITSLGFAALVSYLAVRSHRREVTTGKEWMVGAPGQVLDWRGNSGQVFTRGERWQAVADAPLEKGQKVRVADVNGLVLTVEPDNADTS